MNANYKISSLQRHQNTTKERYRFLQNDLKLQTATDQKEDYFMKKIFLSAKALYELYKTAIEKALTNCDEYDVSSFDNDLEDREKTHDKPKAQQQDVSAEIGMQYAANSSI